MMAKLQTYHKRWGNADAPLKTALGDWAAAQRLSHSRGTMAPEREQALDALGFSWASPTDIDDPLAQCDWDDMCLRLAAHREAVGHSDVPKKHKADPWLGGWVAAIRRNKHMLNDAQTEQLDALEFPWIARRQCGSAFMSSLQELGSFREEHGHVDVARVLGEAHELTQWCENQRAVHAQGSLSPKRVAHLEELDFDFRG